MSFVLLSEKGFVADLGSATAYWDLMTAIELLISKGPLRDFIVTGRSTKPNSVVKQIDQLLPRVSDSSTRACLTELRLGLSKCKKSARVA